MENTSVSPTSQDSLTNWAPDAFPWGLSILAVIGLLGVVVLVSVISAFIYLAMTHTSPMVLTHPSLGLALGLQLVLDVAIVAFLLLVLPALGKTSLRGLGFTVPTWQQVGFAVLGAMAMIILVNVLGSLIESLFHVKHQQDVVRMALSIKTIGMKILFAIVALVGAPLTEELTFRVFVFNAVRRHWGFWGGAIVSGIFFGLAHLDKYAFVPLALGGIILCYVYYRTRNAWASMITHLIFNSVTIVALFVNPSLLKQ
ncbi:MAG: CPBP family intramembrane glutamic endopeptidase [Vulcanimicrobiaceae bacterium]